MQNLLNDFIKKAKFIVSNDSTLFELENIVLDVLTRCIKIYEIREGILLIDDKYRIIEANDILFDDFGIDSKKILNKNFLKLFDKEFVDVVKKFLEKTDKEEFNIKNKIYLNFENKEILADIKAEKIEINNHKYFLISIRKKNIDSILYKLSVIEEEISNIVMRIKDFDSLMKEILKIFINSEIFNFGLIAKLDNELKKIIPIMILDKSKKIDISFYSLDYQFFTNIFNKIYEDDLIIEDLQYGDKLYKNSFIFPIYKKWDISAENDIAYMILLHNVDNSPISKDNLIYLKEIIYKINIAISDIFIKEKANLIISTDTLTLLPKREMFVNEIKKIINEKIPFGIVIIDIDKLKKVNEILGFWAGDKAIKKFTSFLKEKLKNCFIARIGSDEFGIIIKGNKEKIFSNLEKILSFNDDIVQINGSGVYLPISIGVAFFPEDGKKEEDLIILAEEALNTVKKRGGKGIAYANKNLTLLPKDYIEIEKELKEAIKKDEFVMYYQPIIDINSNKIWGVEALLRWNSKKRGLVPPVKFIPILEESGLINEVGDVIIDKVLNDVKEFEKNQIIFSFSMNISVIQLLSQNLALKLIKKIQQKNIKKDQIIIEITESVLMENIDVILPQINKLQEEGIKIEIDDFGTGYSSLAYLRKLPVSALKIDRSFIIDLLNDEENQYIIKAIISMAKALHKKTIAEGVEDINTLNYLKELGVDYVQGYFFAKPMSKKELFSFVKNFELMH